MIKTFKELNKGTKRLLFVLSFLTLPLNYYFLFYLNYLDELAHFQYRNPLTKAIPINLGYVSNEEILSGFSGTYVCYWVIVFLVLFIRNGYKSNE